MTDTTKDTADKPENPGIKPEPIYTFSVPRKTLEAVQLFQSKDETRTAICCTCFEIRRRNENDCDILVVATDGRRIGKIDTDSCADELFHGTLPELDLFSIDLKGLRKLPRSKEAGVAIVAVFERHAELTCGKYTYKARRVECLSAFPNWRQVFAVDAPAEIAQVGFNFDLLSAFGAAAKMLSAAETIRFSFTGVGRAIQVEIPGSPEFEGILMPTVSDEERAAIEIEAGKTRIGIDDLKKGRA